MAHDLVIRGGLVVDGSGAAPFEADVAIDGNVLRDDEHTGVFAGKALRNRATA